MPLLAKHNASLFEVTDREIICGVLHSWWWELYYLAMWWILLKHGDFNIHLKTWLGINSSARKPLFVTYWFQKSLCTFVSVVFFGFSLEFYHSRNTAMSNPLATEIVEHNNAKENNAQDWQLFTKQLVQTSDLYLGIACVSFWKIVLAVGIPSCHMNCFVLSCFHRSWKLCVLHEDKAIEKNTGTTRTYKRKDN